MSSKVNQDSQVVLLTDALSVLQAVTNNKLPQWEQVLHNIKCLRTVLQWIPSHCGVEGNEDADKMAKLGAKGDQKKNPGSLKEMKSITKSLHSTPQPKDSYHLLGSNEITAGNHFPPEVWPQQIEQTSVQENACRTIPHVSLWRRRTRHCSCTG